MVEQAKRQIWRKGGRFYGYRINCEQVPMLGACTVRAILDDPRMIPYLVIWKSRKGNEVKQAVRLARSVPRTNLSEVESVDIKWPDGSTVRVYLVWLTATPRWVCLALEVFAMRYRSASFTVQESETMATFMWCFAPIGHAANAPGSATLPRAVRS